MTLHEFIHMGGYAAYVWTAYALATAVLAYHLIAPLRNRKQLRQRIQADAAEYRETSR